jgi:mono/diheme cytochrome c family protein
VSVFSANCASCHTLTAAHASGTIGPDLDKLVSYAQQAHKPLTDFVHESIVSPEAYVQPGYPNGVMPQNFGEALSKTQLGALVTYLVQSAQQGGKKG